MVHLNDRRKCARASAPFNRDKDLLRGLMNNHVVDDDSVGRRTKQRSKLLIQAANQVAAFKVMEVAELDISLCCHIDLTKREA
jgi:hypothetical protein